MKPEEKLRAKADQWVRANRKKLIHDICNPKNIVPVDNPVTIFMAGTPGAGKTEFSVNLIQSFGGNFVRIDADEIREMMRTIGYTGANSQLFQKAAAKAVNILFDHANKSGQNVLLDGTFAYGDWKLNVQRSLDKHRKVEIYYLYQDPLIAWEYVLRRKEKEGGRVVPEDVFVQSYQQSVKNVQSAKDIFGDKITLYFAKNDYTKRVESIKVDVANIEKLLPKTYTSNDLKDAINAR